MRMKRATAELKNERKRQSRILASASNLTPAQLLALAVDMSTAAGAAGAAAPVALPVAVPVAPADAPPAADADEEAPEAVV